MEHEIENHVSRKHLKHLPMSEFPYDQTLSSARTFLAKRHGSIGDTNKFESRFCADLIIQELG